MVTSSAVGFIMKPLWHQKEKVSNYIKIIVTAQAANPSL